MAAITPTNPNIRPSFTPSTSLSSVVHPVLSSVSPKQASSLAQPSSSPALASQRSTQPSSGSKSSYPDCSARISGHACGLANTETLKQNLDALLNFATNDGREKLDHVVFTAGDSFTVKSLADMRVESIQKLGIVCFVAGILLGKLLVPKYMTSSAESLITLTGGVNSTKPGAGWSVLAGWGGALEGLLRGFAVDMKPIRVNWGSEYGIDTVDSWR